MGVIKRQGIKNTISGYLGILIGFVNLILIQPHFLTKEELGLTRILFSFSLLVSMFVPLGIGNATLRFFPMFRDEKKGHHGFFAFMNLFPLIGFLVSFLVLWLLKDFVMNQYRRESPLFLEYFNYVFPLIFFNSFINTLTVYCNANLKSTVPSYLNDLGVRLMTIAVVSAYFIKWLTLDQFIAAFVMIYGVQFVMLIGYIFYFDRPKFRIDWYVFKEKNVGSMVRYGLLLWFAGIASLGLKYFDSVMIGKFMPLAFLGIYTIAAFIPTVIEAPLVAFEKIASAKISYAWSVDDRNQIKSIYHQSSLYLFLLGSWLFLMINCNTMSLYTFLPDGYEKGRWVVLIISVGTLFNMATGLNAPILFNSDRYRYGAFFLIALAVLVLALQYWLIPIFGLEGAALATALASIVYNSMLMITVWKLFRLQPFDSRNLRVLVVFLVSYASSWLLPEISNPYLSILFNSMVLTAIFVGGVHFVRIVPEIENQVFEKISFRKK
jgi:O-antigen/teichoic acid export membrane protein